MYLTKTHCCFEWNRGHQDFVLHSQLMEVCFKKILNWWLDKGFCKNGVYGNVEGPWDLVWLPTKIVKAFFSFDDSLGIPTLDAQTVVEGVVTGRVAVHNVGEKLCKHSGTTTIMPHDLLKGKLVPKVLAIAIENILKEE